MRRTAKENDFELILTIKILDIPYRAILVPVVSSGRSVIVAELWPPKVARPGNLLSNFASFLKKTFIYGIICKILFRKFSPGTRSTLCYLNFVKCCRREMGEIVHRLHDRKKNKISAAFQTVATAWISPKYARACPQQCIHSAPDFIQIGSLSAEL